MRTTFIHGLNSKAGGGKSILSNFLRLLKQSEPDQKYIVLVPDRIEYQAYANERIEILDAPSIFKTKLFLPIFNRFVLPRWLQKLKVDTLFTLADIAVPTKTPQVYLFDWSYAVYPNSVAWKRMDLLSYLSRVFKLFFFKQYIRVPSTVIAQTDTMKERLLALYGLRDVQVVPNPVALDSLTGGEAHDFKLPKEKIKLLYLTHYYPHKNLEIFLPLAEEIKRLSLPYILVVTLDPSQHHKAARFLENIVDRNLQDIIMNVGSVPMAKVPSLYGQVQALLMPTLLESFSGSYVEAMHHKKTILTSNFDFAKDICGDAAYYFDALDARSILNSINLAFGNETDRAQKISAGATRVANLLTWEQVFSKFQEIIQRSMAYEH